MKLTQILPFAALGTAFVLPSEELLADVQIEENHRGKSWFDNAVASKDAIVDEFKQHFDEVASTVNEAVTTGKNALDDAFDQASNTAAAFSQSIQDSAVDAEAWFEDEEYNILDGRHHRPPHHEKPKMTVYELIAKSKYTTKLAKLINEYPDLVEALNGHEANYTVFAPTDKAFEKIPEHAPKPSKEELRLLLTYHVTDSFYPAGRVLASHTIPTLLESEHLGSEPLAQRLSRNLSFRGLTLNFYARIIAINIFGTNGVIHGLDSIILPPPTIIKIIKLLPGEFSTLELGLFKTGLLDKLNTDDHPGGTFFAPSNFAFQKLGPRINAFLFSKHGFKYLKALLEYHVVPGNTLYSDAFYQAESTTTTTSDKKGYFHVDLPTFLEDRSLSVDVARYGGFIRIKINAFSTVTVQDGVAEDGVIQVVSDVLVPPKKLGGMNSEVQYWDGAEMSVEEFVERFEPFVAKGDL